MTQKDKTPLQAVVSVICDLVAELSADDQARAFEAARVTLGLRAPVAQKPEDQNPYRDVLDRVPPPRVEVQMMGGSPMVLNPPLFGARPARVLVDPLRPVPARQLTAPRDNAEQTVGQTTRGYVRSRR